MRADRKAIGLSKSQHDALTDIAEVWRNETEKQDDRFWHMKAYWIRHGERVYTAVGSCNFTEAGLAGAGGNVEAMLVFEASSPNGLRKVTLPAWKIFPNNRRTRRRPPSPFPWSSSSPTTGSQKAGAGSWTRTTRRAISNCCCLASPLSVSSGGSDECRGDPPDMPAHYQVTYTQHAERREWKGQVVELHLDHNRRTYGKPLSASDILESWRVHVKTGDPGPRDGEGDGDEDGDYAQAEVPAAFDAVNLYDLYRAMRALRTRLAKLESEPQAQRALLVGRSDSVMALARLADGDGEARLSATWCCASCPASWRTARNVHWTALPCVACTR